MERDKPDLRLIQGGGKPGYSVKVGVPPPELRLVDSQPDETEARQPADDRAVTAAFLSEVIHEDVGDILLEIPKYPEMAGLIDAIDFSTDVAEAVQAAGETAVIHDAVYDRLERLTAASAEQIGNQLLTDASSNLLKGLDTLKEAERLVDSYAERGYFDGELLKQFVDRHPSMLWRDPLLASKLHLMLVNAQTLLEVVGISDVNMIGQQVSQVFGKYLHDHRPAS